MTKITFIGAGSLGFTTELVRDILTFPLLEDATISLMDIDAERLEWAKKNVDKLVAAGKRPAKVEATLDRVEALKGADVVLTTILAGSTEVPFVKQFPGYRPDALLHIPCDQEGHQVPIHGPGGEIPPGYSPGCTVS